MEEEGLATFQSIRAHQFGDPGLFPALKLTDLYLNPACQLDNSPSTRVRQSQELYQRVAAVRYDPDTKPPTFTQRNAALGGGE